MLQSNHNEHYRTVRARLLAGVSLHRQALLQPCALPGFRLSAVRVMQRQLAALRQAKGRLEPRRQAR